MVKKEADFYVGSKVRNIEPWVAIIVKDSASCDREFGELSKQVLMTFRP